MSSFPSKSPLALSVMRSIGRMRAAAELSVDSEVRSLTLAIDRTRCRKLLRLTQTVCETTQKQSAFPCNTRGVLSILPAASPLLQESSSANGIERTRSWWGCCQYRMPVRWFKDMKLAPAPGREFNGSQRGNTL